MKISPRFLTKRRLISAFLLFHIVVIPLCSTEPVTQMSAFGRFFVPYLWWTRLRQRWGLLSPSPVSFARRYRAEIVFRNGFQQTWWRPDSPNWGFFERHLAYNFQKWDLASYVLDEPVVGSRLWNDLGHYLTRKYWDEANPPQSIRFVRSIAKIPPPQPQGYAGTFHAPGELDWTDSTVHVYDVATKRLTP